jgi:hypothetical protein
MLRCPRCDHANKKTNTFEKRWRGFSYALEVLTLSFPRPENSKPYKVTLSLETGLKPYMRDASEKKTQYRLVTVTKKLDYRGDFMTFVHSEDGKWWACHDGKFRPVPIDNWQGDVKNGDAIMAMYERLDG